MATVEIGTKVLSGTYHVQYTAFGEKASIGLFKEDVTLNEQNSTISFSKENIAEVEVVLTQTHPTNFELQHLSPLYWADGKFNSISGVNFNENINLMYLSKVKYDSIFIDYSVEKNQQIWVLTFDLGEVDLVNDKTLTVDGDLTLNLVENEYSKEDFGIESPLYHYFNEISLINGLNQNVHISAWDVESNGSAQGTSVNAKVVIEQGEKKFEKVVPLSDLGYMSIKDLTGDESLIGDVTMEIFIDNALFEIAPYSQIITIKE